jgi:tetratricopeptide (TPR) repeat protein
MRHAKKNPRALIVSLLLAAFSFAQVLATAASQEKLPPPTGQINDFAEVLDAKTKQRLEAVLQNLKTRTGIDLTIAAVNTTGNEDLYDYSLRIANEWNVGSRTSPRKTLLLVIAADNGRFFTQFSRAAQPALPDGLIGEMGRQMNPSFSKRDFNAGLVSGVKAFVNGLGERDNFTFAQLDTDNGQTAVARTRPRTVESPSAPADTPSAEPAVSPSPEVSPTPTETPLDPTPTPTAEATVTAETPTPEPTPAATVEATPAATAEPTVTPLESPSPSPTVDEGMFGPPKPIPSPSASPEETPAGAEASPSPAEVARTTRGRPARPTRTPAAPPRDPEDEKEEVELTLTKPAAERIDLLKAFIAANPKSVAVPRAQELIISARATVGDQKLQADDVPGGLEQFKLAMSEARADMSDQAFTEVIARIPMVLFVRGQRGAALTAARQAEAMAKLNPVRLLAVTQFYLAIEDAKEANRLAELTVQHAPEMAAAHQALGAARHIELRLDDAESEYAKAIELNPKLTAAKLSLANLKRASENNEAALALYREVLEADPKNSSARAGVVLSLLELGRQEEGVQELNAALQDPEKANNLPLLVGAAYWFIARGDAPRGLDLAQRAVVIEPRYSWGQIAYARALIADKRPLDAERTLRFARNYSRFPTLDYELANVLASVGLYDEAATELSRSFALKLGKIETKLAGRSAASASTFTELLAPERRAAIFQARTADSDANARRMKALLAFTNALNADRLMGDDDLHALAQEFTAGDDPMRAYRQIYVAQKFLKKNVALSAVTDLMESASAGVEAALDAPAATVAVQAEELADARFRELGRGATPSVPDAPRAVLAGILRARIEDLAGMALFNLSKNEDAVLRLRRAVSVAPEGTPIWRSSMWHLAAALEATGKNDQALLYYIKSYLAGPRDLARRSVIENVYQKVNGTLDGLDEKIGPGPASAAPTPAASPKPNQ